MVINQKYATTKQLRQAMPFIVATGPTVAENRGGYFTKISRWEPKNHFAKVSVKLLSKTQLI